MLAFSYITIFILLLLISLQDFKFRAISWIWIPLLFGLILYKSVLISSRQTVWESFLHNSIFIVLQFGILILYFSIRNRKFEPVINSYIGIGDLLFLLAIAPSLCFGNFLLFVVLSILLLLSVYSLFIIFKYTTKKQIPLAGIQSLFLLFWLMSEWWFVPQLSFTYIPLYFVN